MNVFPNVKYCVCIQYLLRNLKLLFKDPLIDKIYFNGTKSYNIGDFEFNMRWMVSICPNIRTVEMVNSKSIWILEMVSYTFSKKKVRNDDDK